MLFSPKEDFNMAGVTLKDLVKRYPNGFQAGDIVNSCV